MRLRTRLQESQERLALAIQQQQFGQFSKFGGRGGRDGGRGTKEGGRNIGCMEGKHGGRGTSEHVGEQDVTCHYCKEKCHNLFGD